MWGSCPTYLLSLSFTCGSAFQRLHPFYACICLLLQSITSTLHDQNTWESFCPLKSQMCSWYDIWYMIYDIIWYDILNADLLETLKVAVLKSCLWNRPLLFSCVCFRTHWNREVRGGTPNNTKKTMYSVT